MTTKTDDDGFPWVGENIVYDDGERTDGVNLWNGKIVMKGYTTPIMIRKGGTEIKKSCYDMMKKFQHNSCIPHLDFFMDEKNKMGRLVLPVVKASFDKWVRNVGREHLFDENGDMSTLFRTMIADICAIIIKLQENKDENDEPNPIMIKNLFISNLYLANEEPPRILLLVTEAEYKRAATRSELLNPVQKIIEWCSDVCSVKLNSASLRYCGFLVTPQFTVRNLRSYPHKWDYHIKGEYLFSLIAAPKRKVENALMKAEVSWPLDNGELPYVLVKIIEYQSGQSTGPSYDETVPYDYVLLLKDTFKHSFKFPSLLKELVGSREQFIAQVEKWSPNIWLDIYDQIGWP